MIDDDPGHQPLGAAAAEAPAREHFTLSPLPWLAGASDVGLRHASNQDAIALAGRDTDRGRVAVLAVADGVSTSLGSEQSAAIAAEVACSTLVAMLRNDPWASAEQLRGDVVDAVAAANDAVLSSRGPGPEPGSCTLILAVVNQGRITVGNVGDCRAYWVGDDGAAQVLSVDDSVAQARIELGMSREEAESGFQAHAITRWIGPNSTDVEPRQVTTEVTVPGWLLVCSDGLWNYCSPAEQMAALVLEAAAQNQHQVTPTVQMLVRWAIQQGGRDNITAALCRVEDSAAAAPE